MKENEEEDQGFMEADGLHLQVCFLRSLPSFGVTSQHVTWCSNQAQRQHFVNYY